jgi:tol-pal system protein YbgF
MMCMTDEPRMAGISIRPRLSRAVASGIAAGRVVSATAGLLLLLAAAPAAAQDADLRSLADQMNSLQRELSDLQRTVYNGAAPPAGAAAATGGGNLAASQEIRLQQLQGQMSGLTGQVEELGYQMTRLQERVDRLAEAVGTMMRGEGGAAADQPPAAQTSEAQPLAGGGATTAAPSTPGTLGSMTQSQLDAAQSGAASADVTGAGQPAQLTPPQTAAMPTGPYDLPGNTPDEQYQYAFGLLRQANYPEAERALHTFIERNPTSPLAGNAQYWLGETFYVRGDYQNAAVAFAEGYQKYPDSGKAPDNLLKLGMSLGEIGAKDDACTAFNQLAKQFPAAPANIKERATSERQRIGC